MMNSLIRQRQGLITEPSKIRLNSSTGCDSFMLGWRGGGLHLDSGQNQQKLSEGNGKAIILQMSVSPILYFAVAGC